MNKSLILFMLCVTMACNNKQKIKAELNVQMEVPSAPVDGYFQECKNIYELKCTYFIPTLEHKIYSNDNTIYCATLLFAWDEVRKEIGSPITISENYKDLILLNQSNSFVDVLKRNEYSISKEIVGDKINVRAIFNKSLPFETKLQSLENKLTFDGNKVQSFGFNIYANREQLALLNIVYYKNDDNFIIKLQPKEESHEVILFKSESQFSTMSEMVAEINRLTEVGKTEMMNTDMYWKYRYDKMEDRVVIPKIKFDIETNYTSLEESHLEAKGRIFDIKRAWQKKAFALDESGAEIKSAAKLSGSASIEEEKEKEKPKKMIFDKPFLILLKRKDAPNPYFGLWVANAELMIKEE